MDSKLNKCNWKTTKLLLKEYCQSSDIFKIENAPCIRFEMENPAILLFPWQKLSGWTLGMPGDFLSWVIDRLEQFLMESYIFRYGIRARNCWNVLNPYKIRYCVYIISLIVTEILWLCYYQYLHVIKQKTRVEGDLRLCAFGSRWFSFNLYYVYNKSHRGSGFLQMRKQSPGRRRDSRGPTAS